MSNLLKSKIFLGLMVLGLAVSANAGHAKATALSCDLSTKTLGYKRSTNTVAAVKCLQQYLGATADGKFGPATKAKVVAFQAANNLTADGLVGNGTKAVLMGTSPVVNPSTGCTTAFDPATGLPCVPGSNPGTQTGPVTVSLSSDNPAAGYVINNQATADLAHFAFNGSGTVSSVTLRRTGISDQNTLTNVYLYNGNTRLTDGYSFNNAGTLTMNNLGLMVNGSMNVSVKADVSSTAGNTASTIGVALTGFTSGASVNTVNLAGNMMYVGVGSPATVYLDSANQTVTGTPAVNAGTSAYTVWSNNVQVNTRAVLLKGANFRMVGSAPAGALANIHLYVDGIAAGGVATVNSITGSNYAMFDFSASPLSLGTGSHTFDVRADVVSGSSYTVQTSLQQAADLVLVDPQLNINIAVSKNSTTAYTTSAGGTITINPGSASVVIDPTFSAMTNITGGSTNATIAKFKVHGYGEDVKVSTLSILPVMANTPTLATGTCTAGTDCSLNNVTVYFNGSQVGSQQNWNGVSSNVLSFNLGSQMIVPAATDSTIEVRADLQNASSVNYTGGSVAATMKLGSSNGQGQTSHTTLNFPTGDKAGTALTIQTGLLAVAKNTGYADQSQNPNTAGVRLGSFTLQNQSSSESVRVTSLLVAVGGSSSLTNLSNLRTSEVSGSGATPVQPAASNTFSVDFTLAPGATKTIDVLGDTSTSTSVNVIASLTVTSVGSSSHVSISQNGNGTAVVGQTITLTAGTLGTPAILTGSATSAQYVAAGNGATDATNASFNFVSTGGSTTITDLKFTVTGTGTVQSIKVGSVTAPVVAGVAWLSGLNLVVPNGGAGLQISALVTYSSVGTGGIAPGTTSVTSLTYVKSVSGGTTSEMCTSGCTTTITAVDAPTMTMVGSKPTVTVNTTTNGGLNIGGVDQKIGEVTVAADAKGNIKINDLKFTVTSVGFTTVPTFTLARIADGSTTITGSSCGQGVAAAASQTVFCEFGTTGNSFTTTTAVTNTESNTDFDGYIIPAGTSKTFSLYATVTAANTGTNLASISSSLNAAGFNWDDASYATFVADGTTASPANGTNLTGASIYNFPTGSYTVHQ